MSIFRYLLPKSSTKRKILDIKAEIKKLVQQYCNEQYDISWYGAYEVNPKHLVFWIHVNSDEMKTALNANKELNEKLRGLLIKFNYPEKARKYVHIGFESQETVDRESDGNWYHHFK